MPQISKVRIVNFKYNDGNRFIPDELYDLANESGEALSSLFNLNNGGGKTVLVQLMMQPVNPKAMASGRRIEDYFTRQGDHSYVLIEWTTDGSKEKLLTGIAMAASISNSTDDNQRGNSIRYYTFKTVYENYSPYSIASLELSKNENGRYVPATFEYVRERARQSKGVLEYYSSEDRVKWMEELANYGILRSEWENVIETLNKDEGGLNQYFDEAKTSDKLISKFFIPAIEQKIKSAGNSRTDGSLETMLISYAKKISEKESVIQEHDTNKRLLASLAELNEMSEQLYAANDEFVVSIGDVCGFKKALAKRIGVVEAEISSLETEMERQRELIAHIEHEEKSKAYYEACDRLEQAVLLYEEAKERLDQSKGELERLEHQEDILQCAKLHKQIVENEGQICELKKLIEEKENDSEDAERIAILKYSVYAKASEKKSELETKQRDEEARLKTERDALVHAQKDKKEADDNLSNVDREYMKAESALDETKKATDRLVDRLGIGAIRQFDGFYQEDDIDGEKNHKTQQQKNLKHEIEQLQSTLHNLEERKEQIPEEKARVVTEIDGKEKKKEEIQKEIAEFDKLYKVLEKLCEKYSLDINAIFSDRLKRTIQEEYENSRAKVNKGTQDKEALGERLTAAKNGHVHILPKIMEYVKSTGISCQTGEEYLCNLVEFGNMTSDEVEDILEKYPEVAYSLLFNSESDLKRFTLAGNIEWLPAIVPLLTMEQINSVFVGELTQSVFLAACDKDYFADRTGYCDKIAGEISEIESQIERYRLHGSECEEEIRLVQQFVYSIDWKAEQESIVNRLENEIGDLSAKLVKLDVELKQVKEQYISINEELNTCKDELSSVNHWLELSAELILKMAEEIDGFEKIQKLSIECKNAENASKEAERRVKAIETSISEVQNAMNVISKALTDLHNILSKVCDAREASIIDGEIDSLYSQYTTLCDNMSEGLEQLNSKLQSVIEEKDEREKELSLYRECTVEEYESVTFDSVQLERIKGEISSMRKVRDELQVSYDSCNEKYITCRANKNLAENNLEDYGGVALPKNEIGVAFRDRRKAAKGEIKVLTEKKGNFDDEKRGLVRISDNVSDAIAKIKCGEINKDIELTSNPENQWSSLKKKLYDCENDYEDKKDKLSNRIRDVVNEYRDITLAEIVSKLNTVKAMLEDVEKKGDRLFTVSESIEAMIGSIEKINSKIETDLREINNDFEDIVNQCVNQGRRMYTDLRSIAASSKAHIFPGKPQTQMVKMTLPEESEISDEASRNAIKIEIENGANEIKRLMQEAVEYKEILKRAKKIVSSQRLLLRYIRQDSIQVKVYKIDMNAENSGYKRWEDTLTQSSGAEKFVVFFAVVLTLMNYTRSSAGLVSKNSKSVLVLDNPFGKITSAHLLKPMFDIAKHFNVQLICLSDINKSDVINCFDCVIKLVIKSQSLSNIEIMTHEGNERIEHGYYKVMNGQMSLF